MNDKHLEGLALIEKRLVKAYATTVMGEVHVLEVDVPENLRKYVEIEIALREITHLTK